MAAPEKISRFIFRIFTHQIASPEMVIVAGTDFLFPATESCTISGMISPGEYFWPNATAQS
jgi:hypothetical protein